MCVIHKLFLVCSALLKLVERSFFFFLAYVKLKTLLASKSRGFLDLHPDMALIKIEVNSILFSSFMHAL